ncbi:hypothetical protein DEA8626_01979 [Defluviimonas aquaemixtae]|uniref:Uncharacterized protein n=1 Tax=Albidovulum aquaemixtae TaxID=1542388 RepID=A0A2R8B722_9RHOB|nr:hypothetical protein [Defluviimonas aquaemixtae]SPH18441.1 hypothetical protein DEA8626_01979 [Defluviimonas aquaemixtae]
MISIAVRTLLYIAFLAFPAILIMRYGEIANDALSGTQSGYASSGYASQVFGNVVAFDEVLSSRLVGRTRIPACSLVFVRLSANPPTKPPTITLNRNRSYRFGGAWQPTPMREATPVVDDLLGYCGEAIGKTAAAELRTALSSEGSYYTRDLVDGSVHVYAPTLRLAGRVRYLPYPH